MKRGKARPVNHEPRCYQTACSFHLSARERLRALLGGKVHVHIRILVASDTPDIRNEIIKRVDAREWRWPWRKAA